MRNGSRRLGGFAYLLLLATVAIVGLAAGAALSLGAAMARRDAEQHLLAVGLEFQQALRTYSTPGPRSLEDLLKDPRTPGLRRHLRQIRADPLTGRQEWGVVTDGQGFITGVHSLAEGRPIKRSGFEPSLAHFEEAPDYRQWVFGPPPSVPPRP